MEQKCKEPRLGDMLGDPIVRTIMSRDRVVEADLLAIIDQARLRLWYIDPVYSGSANRYPTPGSVNIAEGLAG